MAEDKIKVKVYFELKLLPKPVGLSVQCFNVIGLGCCNVWQVDKPTSRQVDKSTSWKADSQVTQKAHVQVLVLLTHHLSWTDVNRPKEAIWAKFVAVKSHGVKTNRGDKLWDKKQEFQKHGFLFLVQPIFRWQLSRGFAFERFNLLCCRRLKLLLQGLPEYRLLTGARPCSQNGSKPFFTLTGDEGSYRPPRSES